MSKITYVFFDNAASQFFVYNFNQLLKGLSWEPKKDTSNFQYASQGRNTGNYSAKQRKSVAQHHQPMTFSTSSSPTT